MTNRVVVHDLDELEEFGKFLDNKREEIEELYDTLLSECEEQRDNWDDPQYETLKDKIEEYHKDSQKQLERLDENVRYIENLVRDLRAITR